MYSCLKCGKEHDGLFGSGKYCSRSCANGRTFTDETKKKISIANTGNQKVINAAIKGGNATAKKIYIPRITKICLFCGNKFSVKSNNIHNYCSYHCMQLCPTRRLKLAQSLKYQYKIGRKVYGGKTKWYDVNTLNGNIRVQGTYEVRTCKILDTWVQQNKIKNWEYTNDRVKYIGTDGKEHSYLLDFKIFNLEVKGYEKTNDKLKWQAVEDLGYRLEVWFNSNLKEIEMNI